MSKVKMALVGTSVLMIALVVTLLTSRANTETHILNFIENMENSFAITESGAEGTVARGQANVLMDRYSFSGNSEAYTITKLTLDNKESASAIQTVHIEYTDKNGATKTQSGALAGGSITFSALTFYVPQNQTATLKVYVDVSAQAPLSSVTGQGITIVLRLSGNNATTSTIIGEESSRVYYSPSDELVCESPNVTYEGECTDPIPPCRNWIINAASCIDKITSSGEYIDHYNFSCMNGYEIAVNTCVKSNTSGGENEPPTVRGLDRSFEGSQLTNGTKVKFNAVIQDPEVDSVRYQFVVCRFDGSICYNILPAKDTLWQGSSYIYWTPEKTGKYMVTVAVVDGHHEEESNPDGDDKLSFNFTVVSGATTGTTTTTTTATTNTAVTTSKTPPAGYEDEVLTTFDSNPFPDTDVADLGGRAAAELYRRAVIGGFPDGQFKGDRPVNRAEAAKFLLLTLFKDVYETSNDGRFGDVLNDQWYTKYVMVAAIKGIISGYPDGTFKPANTVNTAEFLKMLTITFGLEENQTYTYLDVNSTDWFARYAGTAEKYELFPDRTNYLLPGKELTRKEVAIAIYQYLTNR